MATVCYLCCDQICISEYVDVKGNEVWKTAKSAVGKHLCWIVVCSLLLFSCPVCVHSCYWNLTVKWVYIQKHSAAKLKDNSIKISWFGYHITNQRIRNGLSQNGT